MAAYLTAALEDGDAEAVVAVLADIARAKGMRQVVESAGLHAGGRVELSAVLRVVRALGFRLEVAPVVKRGRAQLKEGVAPPSLGDFARLVSGARKAAKKTRMAKKDITNAVKRVRRAR